MVQGNIASPGNVIWRILQNDTLQLFRRWMAKLLSTTRKSCMVKKFFVLVYLAESARFVTLQWAN
jgi:hypothetical protein